MAAHHRLKTWPAFFEAVIQGKKTFEYRKDDRNPRFEAGDTLGLMEWNPVSKEYTGRHVEVDVTYVLRGQKLGLPKGYCVLAIKGGERGR